MAAAGVGGPAAAAAASSGCRDLAAGAITPARISIPAVPSAPSTIATNCRDVPPDGPLVISSTETSQTERLTVADIGAKALNCFQLSSLARKLENQFVTPYSWVLPCGSMEVALQRKILPIGSQFKTAFEAYRATLEAIDAIPLDQPVPTERLDSLEQFLEEQLELTPEQTSSLQQALGDAFYIDPSSHQPRPEGTDKPRRPPTLFAVRSSSNTEDLPGFSGAGLHESVLNLDPISNFAGFSQGIIRVWVSLHSRRAVLARRMAGIREMFAQMAVLIQNVVWPCNLSFVMHTRCCLPEAVIQSALDVRGSSSQFTASASSDNWIYVELALGLGEALGGTLLRGTPHRLLISRVQSLPDKTAEFLVLGYSSLGVAAFTFQSNFGSTDVEPLASFTWEKVADIIQDPFVRREGFRATLAGKLQSIALLLERDRGTAQDVEGVVQFAGEEALSCGEASNSDSELTREGVFSSPSSPDIVVAVVQARPLQR